MWREVASSLVTGIKFTVELPEDHENWMVPILDVQAKMVREFLGQDTDGEMLHQDRIEYKFFKKPTANWLLVQEMGALPARAKYSTLAAEVMRRLRNTCEQIPDQETVEILTRFSKAMESSGYGDLARAEAVWAGLKGHRNILARKAAGNIPETDRAWGTRGRRQIRKLKEKANWFQKERQIEGNGEVTGNGETGETGNTGISWRHSGKNLTKVKLHLLLSFMCQQPRKAS